jgi:hypothetical protein
MLDRMSHVRQAVVLAALLAVLGCDSMAFKGDAVVHEPAANAAGWPFAPVSMRVHPFTSINYDPELQSLVLEVRVELVDQLGDVTKGVGDLRFELYAEEDKASQKMPGVRINQWDAPMTTLEQNRQHYDAITRTYAFKLRLNSPPPAGQKLRVVAQFTDVAGHRLMAEGTLNYTPRR